MEEKYYRMYSKKKRRLRKKKDNLLDLVKVKKTITIFKAIDRKSSIQTQSLKPKRMQKKFSQGKLPQRNPNYTKAQLLNNLDHNKQRLKIAFDKTNQDQRIRIHRKILKTL